MCFEMSGANCAIAAFAPAFASSVATAVAIPFSVCEVRAAAPGTRQSAMTSGRKSSDALPHPLKGKTKARKRAFSGASRARTGDLLAASQTLSQLSYGPRAEEV